MKILLWIASILFFLLSWWWYVCPHKKVCPFGEYADHISKVSSQRDNSGSAKVIVDGLDLSILEPDIRSLYDNGRILFGWSNDKPYTSNNFINTRDSILNTLGETDLLEVVGKYFSGEENKTPFPNLGFARANKIKLLFSGLPSDRFSLKSSVISSNTAANTSSHFEASSFRRVVKNESVKEIAGTVIIKFPHASDEMFENSDVSAYLDELILRMNDTDEIVLVVGHTDNTASVRRNISLGWKRADAIRNLLLRKGLSSTRIITESKGEAEPIASNDTHEGREQNRRVEVTLIPNNL